MVKLSDYNIAFPKENIAQYPPKVRGESQLLIVNRDKLTVVDDEYKNFHKYLKKGDVLVLNDTRVIPARLFATTESGRTVEVFLLEKHPAIREFERQQGEYNFERKCLIGTAKKLKDDKALVFKPNLKAEIIGKTEEGVYKIKFAYEGEDLEAEIENIGHTSLPPYIKRPDEKGDRDRYQTVFAKEKGAVAAPTASLNMTRHLLRKIKEKGVEIAYITLHVGYGSFKTIKSDNLNDHRMHSEWFSIPDATAEAVNMAKKEGRRIVAAGTTVSRCIEFVADDRGFVRPVSGEANNFIYPGYKFKCIDVLLTNFHAPQTSVLMLTTAFMANFKNNVEARHALPLQIDVEKGRKLLFDSYEKAVKLGYRFLSYGDSMMII